MYGLRQEVIPADGVEHATFLVLTPSNKLASTSRKVIGNLVLARSNVLRVFEMVEEPAPLPSLAQVEEQTRGDLVRKGTEAVEGEVEMDAQGEGFVNMAQVKHIPEGISISQSTIVQLYFLREHRLHGIITGLERVQTISSAEDGLDRLLISFCDAKISLMEWAVDQADLVTVSIHTYERAPQIMSLTAPSWRGRLRTDSEFRCAGLLLPKDAIAILPFQTQAELEIMEQEQASQREVPYAPSFILDLTEIDTKIRNVIDVVFVPGFNNPTIAVAYQTTQTWAGRLNEFKDTSSLCVITLDLVTRSYPVIAQVDHLPHDVLYLVPCPSSLGGVMAITSNAILHIDQASKVVGIAVNGWANRVTAHQLPLGTDQKGDPFCLALEGSQMVFVDDSSIILFLADGDIRNVKIHLEGRSISKLELTDPVAYSTLPSTVTTWESKFLFVGSTGGPSMLLKAVQVEKLVEKVDEPAPVEDDMELDEDIYGDIATQPAASGTNGPTIEKTIVLQLSVCDTIPGNGSISDMTFGIDYQDETLVPELVACTGVGEHGGLTRFTKHLPTRTIKKLPVVGGSQGIWSISVKNVSRSVSSVAVGGQPLDNILITSDSRPTPGISKIMKRNHSGEIQILSRSPGKTIAVGSFFQNECFVQVMTNVIRVMEPNGNERELIKDLDDSNKALPKIRSAQVSDPHVLIVREDNSVSLFVGDMMSKSVKKVSTSLPPCRSAAFFNDKSGLFGLPLHDNPEFDQSQLEDVLDSDRGTIWVILHLINGQLQIRSLPQLSVAYATNELVNLSQVMIHSADPPHEDAASSEIEQFCLATLGQGSSITPYLLALTSTSWFVAYRIVPSYDQLDSGQPTGSPLPIKFVKVLTKSLGPAALASNGQRRLIPFEIEHEDRALSGVFCTGYTPFWFVAPRLHGPKYYPALSNMVYSFCASSLFGSRSDFMIFSESGPSLVRWAEDIQIGMDLPYRHIHVGRQYTSILFDPTSKHILAVSTQKAKFSNFDDEGKPTWIVDGPGISDPQCESSSLELISPDTWSAVDGYEFAQNEFVNTAKSVSLETLSTEKGQKDYVAVGTTIYRGEDLAVKGATYIFEVIEVVPEPDSPKRRYKLRLLCRDEAKGPVSAVCGINGYLVSSMGQKLYVRAFELDERLVGVAFLDVGLYVTSLTTLKNLLLIGDEVKSVWFVAFQEDPFKLQILSKDPRPCSVTHVNFFFGDNRDLSFITADQDGILRMYDFDPLEPQSTGGQRLLCRTEFDTHSELKAMLTVARRPPDLEDIADDEVTEETREPQSLLICASSDGAISIISPTDAIAFKRLSLLQGQLMRNVQHAAGLNPKGFRTVRNDTVSKPLSKGLLDGLLLSAFVQLSIRRQIEMTRQIGTDREVVLSDMLALDELW
ncbi:mRNA cleavage and polyadenylation factor subunit [Tulasnella sp. 418]|nr:mRNA cleavage and polyadenylation factor subunit [Tulasnella sp. 418]